MTKKQSSKKLVLAAETIKLLAHKELVYVAGGGAPSAPLSIVACCVPK